MTERCNLLYFSPEFNLRLIDENSSQLCSFPFHNYMFLYVENISENHKNPKYEEINKHLKIVYEKLSIYIYLW